MVTLTQKYIVILCTRSRRGNFYISETIDIIHLYLMFSSRRVVDLKDTRYCCCCISSFWLEDEFHVAG